MQTINVGVVGAGYISDLHLRALALTEGVRAAAICDVVAARSRAKASEHGIAAYTDVRQMVDDERLDAVHVTTPAQTHAALVTQLLELGVDVLVEKPFASDSVAAAELARLSTHLGRKLGVSHNMSFDARFASLLKHVRAGRLGHVDHVDVHCIRPFGPLRSGPHSGWLFERPGNPLIELGPHSAGMLLALAGFPDELAAITGDPIELDNGVVFPRRWDVIGMSGRTGIRLCWGFGDGYPEFRVHVRGASGSATADLQLGSFTVERQGRQMLDLDAFYTSAASATRQMMSSAQTAASFALGRVARTSGGGAFADSITTATRAFHAAGDAESLDDRLRPEVGYQTIDLLERIVEAAALRPEGELLPRPQELAISSDRTPVFRPSVLVTGGSGLIGREVVRHLIEAGIAVRTLSRRGKNDGSVDSGVEEMIGDFTAPEDAARAVEGVTAVCHLAFSAGRTWTEVVDQDVEPTFALATAAASAGVERLIFASTIAIYWAGHRAGTIDESTPADPGVIRVNPYARGKAEVERQIRERTALPVVVIRPGIVIGRGGSPIHWGVGAWPNPNVCALWGSGHDALPFVTASDCGRAIATALTTREHLATSYNLVGDVRLTGHEYLDLVESIGGVSIRRVTNRPSRYFAENVAKWALKRVGGRVSPRPSWHDADGRTLRAWFDNSAAKRDLGWLPVADKTEFERHHLAPMIREWYR